MNKILQTHKYCNCQIWTAIIQQCISVSPHPPQYVIFHVCVIFFINHVINICNILKPCISHFKMSLLMSSIFLILDTSSSFFPPISFLYLSAVPPQIQGTFQLNHCKSLHHFKTYLALSFVFQSVTHSSCWIHRNVC